MAIKIRKATKEDAALIFSFIKELAKHEKSEHEVHATESDIKNSLFSENSTTKAIICERGGEPIGFAVYFFSYSTWLGKKSLYLEDLYLRDAERGSGAGVVVLKHLAKIAVNHDCGRLEWVVFDWNKSAITFYESLGATQKSGLLGYQLSGAYLHSLADC
jgi:GNAT superfamily N-acetyltransferase